MVTKNEIKYIQSLCHKKQRDSERLFIAEGPKVVADFIQAGFKVHKIYALQQWIENNIPENILHQVIDETLLGRLSQLQTPNKVVGVFKMKEFAMPNFNNGFHLILDGIQDPGNLGTIIRTADWFGVTSITCSKDTVDVYNFKVVQSTMGSLAHVQINYVNLIDDVLLKTKLPVYGALLQGESIKNFTTIQNGLLVIGNEGKGISNTVKKYIQHAITIDGKGGAESLNAAVATGILLAHLT